MRKLKLQELGRLGIDDFKKSKRIPLVLVLDNIRSMQNVGSLFRSSDAFGIERLILTGITAQPPHRDIHRSALGATDSMDWSYTSSIETACKDLIESGYTLLGLEQTDQSVDLVKYPFKPSERYALIVGNEVDGISDQALGFLDASVEISQWGTKHSLNVSVAGGVALHWISQTIRSLSQG